MIRKEKDPLFTEDAGLHDYQAQLTKLNNKDTILKL